MTEPAANYTSSKGYVASIGGSHLSGKAATDLSDWQNLLNLRPPASVKDSDKKRFPAAMTEYSGYAQYGYQPIDLATGDVNMDMYVVELTTPPKTLLPFGVTDKSKAVPFSITTFQELIRTNFARYMDESIAIFRMFEKADVDQWAKKEWLGAVGHFDMVGLAVNPRDDKPFVALKKDPSSPDACVVCTEYDSYHWVFSTIQVPNLNLLFNGMHPVNGNRQFGVAVRKAGERWSAAYDGNFPPPDKDTIYWYTRGVDRVAAAALFQLPEWGAGKVFSGGDNCWLGLQRKVDKWVHDNGGSARSSGLRRSKREKWDGFVGEKKYGLWKGSRV